MRLATRGSALALAQAGLVRDALLGAGAEAVELVTVQTSGDRAAVPGDKSRWVKEIEDALLAGEADLAVHSAKDVPGELADGLAIVGVPERADARDALCGAASLDDLPAGARVGTGSLRRRAQLLAARDDLEVVELRGNVDTRLRKLADGECDAALLAVAGLVRLGRAGAGVPLDADAITPAPGQGALALEGRGDDDGVAALARRITHEPSLLALTAERALVAGLGAGCRTPVGAHAEVSDEAIALSAFAGLPDGSTWIRDRVEGGAGDPVAVGREAANRMLAAGAHEMLQEAERLA